MDSSSSSVESALLLLFLPKAEALPSIAAFLLAALLVLWFYPGGLAWALSRGGRSIPGPRGMVLALSGAAAHRSLATLAETLRATGLMAFSVGLTRFVVSSRPDTAREILNSSAFADRPIKESAYELLFHRAMGFAPFGEYWRNLRRMSATHLFSPKRIAASGEHRRAIARQMIRDVMASMEKNGAVEVKKVLHFGSLSNVMATVFGKRFDFGKGEGMELEELVAEGYELLGEFNWSDHVPLLSWLDPQGIRKRCRELVSRVDVFVGSVIGEHRRRRSGGGLVNGDFVDVLLDLEKEERLSDSDMVAVLWEMIFRGTDTVAILLEWIMARMVVHQEIQRRAQSELDAVVGSSRAVADADIPNLPYLRSIVKETLRLHPPGPLLSWARLAIHDVHVGDSFIPAGTTAMVNMWAITHDERIWPNPESFEPERFVEEDVSVLGSDLRLAPFGSGRRVCPGKALALATVHLWLAQLLQQFEWVPVETGVDLSECLKMSLEMQNPLACKAFPRY
ncbi:cytochrome P450 [Musa troglodytarum]|uniref:Cytochrome P450 n=1 Tax=Musa troglodytarum TaxID=320322 RepID=A0A9E7KAJ8_9LILI|nr:cytochrome P450 [Musa troglodytarum]